MSGYDKEVLSNLVIYYLFKSKQNAEKVYQFLHDKISGLASKSNSAQLKDLKYSEFYDTTSNLPGLRISLDNGGEAINGFTLTASVIR